MYDINNEIQQEYKRKLEEKLQLKQQELEEINKLVALHKKKTETLQSQTVHTLKRNPEAHRGTSSNDRATFSKYSGDQYRYSSGYENGHERLTRRNVESLGGSNHQRLNNHRFICKV